MSVSASGTYLAIAELLHGIHIFTMKKLKVWHQSFYLKNEISRVEDFEMMVFNGTLGKHHNCCWYSIRVFVLSIYSWSLQYQKQAANLLQCPSIRNQIFCLSPIPIERCVVIFSSGFNNSSRLWFEFCLLLNFLAAENCSQQSLRLLCWH